MIMEIQKVKDQIEKRLQEIGNNKLEEKRVDELKKMEQFISDEEKKESQPEQKK